MYYRIKFKSCPQEFLFELLKKEEEKGGVRVRDVIKKTKQNFKIKRSRLILFTSEDPPRKLDDMDYIESGRTYVVKRLPVDNRENCNNNNNKMSKRKIVL